MQWLIDVLCLRGCFGHEESLAERKLRIMARVTGVEPSPLPPTVDLVIGGVRRPPSWCKPGTLWIYTDPAGQEHGPFDGETYMTWFSKGYLPRDLKVRPARSNELCACPPAAKNAVELPDAVLIDSAPAADDASTSAAGPQVRIGVCCMTKQPEHLATWLTYHAEVVGVEKFFLRIEETPELAALLESPPWASLVECSWASGAPTDWKAMAARQAQHVLASLPCARAAGLTHLLHIDDDELLYAPSGRAALHAALRTTLGDGSSPYCEAHALTMEALAPHADCDNAFLEARAFRHERRAYGSYGCHVGAAGKSFGVLGRAELAPAGPHHFRDGGLAEIEVDKGDFARTLLLPPSTAVTLHFESTSYGRWRKKFIGYARATLEGRRQRFLFDFYRQSAAACAELVRAEALGAGAARLEEAEAAMRRVWARWRLEPEELREEAQAAGDARVLAERGVTVIPPGLRLAN